MAGIAVEGQRLVTALVYSRAELVCNSLVLHSDPFKRSAFFKAEGDPLITPGALRKIAANKGWTHVRSSSGRRFDKDFCPIHNPAKEAQ